MVNDIYLFLLPLKRVFYKSLGQKVVGHRNTLIRDRRRNCIPLSCGALPDFEHPCLDIILSARLITSICVPTSVFSSTSARGCICFIDFVFVCGSTRLSIIGSVKICLNNFVSARFSICAVDPVFACVYIFLFR